MIEVNVMTISEKSFFLEGRKLGAFSRVPVKTVTLGCGRFLAYGHVIVRLLATAYFDAKLWRD